MSDIDAVDDLDGDCFGGYVDWALSTSIWDGRAVTYDKADELHKKALNSLVELLLSKNTSIANFQKMAAAFAWIGSDAENRTLLTKDVQDLKLLSEYAIIPINSEDSKVKFWKKHKKKILIGIAIVAIITVAVVITISASSTAAALAGSAAAASKDKKTKPNSLPDQNPHTKAKEPSEVKLVKEVVFDENCVTIQDQKFSYKELLKKAKEDDLLDDLFPGRLELPISSKRASLPNERWANSTFEKGRLPKSTPSRKKRSRYFRTEGVRKRNCRIGGINGINTTYDEANSHALYLKSFAKEHSIDWVYNQTHKAKKDIGEVLFLNYMGFSPNTSNLLIENWTSFHKENADNPKAKYLQICHSQGAIHVRNALESSPKRIRDRIIVLAIAPAAIIPKKICHESFNYASKKDPIPKTEYYLKLSSSVNLEDEDRMYMQKYFDALQKELILLDPHPDAKGIDHDLQSPTFREKIKKHMIDHFEKNGAYK